MGGENLWLPGSSLQVNQQSSPCHDLLQQEVWEMMNTVREWELQKIRFKVYITPWVLSQLGCGQLCDPMDGSPLASSVQWILQTTVVEWVTVPFSKEIFLTQGLNPCLVSPTLAGGFFTTAAATVDKSLQSCPTLCDPIDGSPPSLGFSRQEHWNGLPLAAPNMYN